MVREHTSQCHCPGGTFVYGFGLVICFFSLGARSVLGMIRTGI